MKAAGVSASTGGAVQAVERATRALGVWTEHRTASQDRPFTQDDDALSAQTN